MADNFLNSFNGMDHAFDGHGDMTSSGSLRFDVDFGRSAREVWFSRQRPEEESLDLDDARESERLEREKGLDTRSSFDNLIAVGVRQDISLRESLDIEDVAHKVIADLREGIETLPESDHTRLQVLRALEDRHARMTREWNTQRATLEEEFTAAAAKGEQLEASRLALLEAFRKLHSVAPFIPDRPDLLPARKLYEVGEDDLKSFQKSLDHFTTSGVSNDAVANLQWAVEIMTHGHSLPEELQNERQRIIQGLQATPPLVLTPEETILFSALNFISDNAPFGPAYPKQTTHLGRDWKEQLDTNRDDVFDLELGHTNLSSIEKDFIKDLESENFMGTGKKTFFWLREIKYDPAASPEMISGLIDTHGNGKEPSPDRPTFAKRLKEIARDLKYVQGQIKRQAGIEHSFEQMVAGETLPVPKIKRELGRLWRNMKRGGGLSLSKASDLEKVLAGLAVVGITWFLSSHEKGKKIGGVFVKGGLGVGVLAGLNVLSGAVLKGKTATEWADKKFALAGRPVDDSIYRIFERHADGKDRDEREQNISYIGDLMKMAGTNNTFGSILEKYKAAKANDTNRIYLDGISDDGMLGDLKKAPSEAAFIAMDIFYRRYGAEIERYEATHDGETPLKELSFTNVVMRLIAADIEYKDKKYPLLWLANKLGDGAEYTMDKIETGFDRVGEALSPKKAKLRKYLKETLFADETKYGTEVNIPRDEHVVILPGGIQTAFRFAEGEKEQDKSPGKELTGFVLEKVDGTPVTFHFNELDPDSVQAFAKQLIIDTGKKKAKESRNPAERRGLDKFNSRSHTLRWNTTTHKWMLPSVIAGEETYTIGGAPVRVPERSQNLFVHSFNQDRGTFGINFFTLSEYWRDPTNVPHHSLEELESRMQEEELKKWIKNNFRTFPFSHKDIYIENWPAIRGNTAPTIEGYATAGAASLRFRGTPSGPWIDFDYIGGVSEEQKRQAFAEQIDSTVANLKELGKKLPEDFFSEWKRFFKLDFEGTFDEEAWSKLLDTEKERLHDLLKESSPQYPTIALYIKELLLLEETLEEKITTHEEGTRMESIQMFERIGHIGLDTPVVRSTYDLFLANLEDNFNFTSEEAKYEFVQLYKEQLIAAENRGMMMTDAEKGGYAALIGQAMMNDSYIMGRHRAVRAISSADVEELRDNMERERALRGAGSTVPTVATALVEWPTPSEYSANPEAAQLAMGVYLIQDAYIQAFENVLWMDVDMQRVKHDYSRGDKIRKDILNLPNIRMQTIIAKWGVKIPLPDFSKVSSPFLQDVLHKGTDVKDWDLGSTILDVAGLGFLIPDEVTIPKSARFETQYRAKKLLALMTEDFLLEKLGSGKTVAQMGGLPKLFKDYDDFIRESARLEKYVDMADIELVRPGSSRPKPKKSGSGGGTGGRTGGTGGRTGGRTGGTGGRTGGTGGRTGGRTGGTGGRTGGTGGRSSEDDDE